MKKKKYWYIEQNNIESWKTTCIKHHGDKLSVSQIGESTAKGNQTKGNQILDELIVTKDTAELWASIEWDSSTSKSFWNEAKIASLVKSGKYSHKRQNIHGIRSNIHGIRSNIHKIQQNIHKYGFEYTKYEIVYKVQRK